MLVTDPVEPVVEGEDLIPAEDLPQDTPPGETPEAKPEETPPAETPPAKPAETPPELEATPEGTPPEPVAEVPLKEVPGETPKETALRLENKRLRTKMRGEAIKDIVDGPAPVVEPVDPYKVLRDKGYTEEQINDMEVTVDLIAKNKGYVHVGDANKQSLQDSVDSFIDDHPEYSSQDETGDSRWDSFQNILKSGIYSIQGKTPRQLKTIFNKVDSDVKKEFGDPIIVTPLTAEQKAAQAHKVQVASHSGGTAPAPKVETEKIDTTQPIGGVMFKGFDDSEDFKE